MFYIDWIVNDSNDGLNRSAWQFSYSPELYRLQISSYCRFKRKDSKSEFLLLEYWNSKNAKQSLPAKMVKQNMIPMPSGIFTLAQESVVGKLQIDKLALPMPAKTIAINALKKQIKYVSTLYLNEHRTGQQEAYRAIGDI